MDFFDQLDINSDNMMKSDFDKRCADCSLDCPYDNKTKDTMRNLGQVCKAEPSSVNTIDSYIAPTGQIAPEEIAIIKIKNDAYMAGYSVGYKACQKKYNIIGMEK